MRLGLYVLIGIGLAYVGKALVICRLSLGILLIERVLRLLRGLLFGPPLIFKSSPVSVLRLALLVLKRTCNSASVRK